MRINALFLAVAVSLTAALPAYASASPTISVGFSPALKGEESAQDVVLDSIKNAKHELLIAAYSFTSKPVALALRDAKARGVDVRVVADKKANSGKYTAVTFLANSGIPVRLNGRFAILHHKFILADGIDVQTGSYNYSSSANSRNAENAVLMRGVPDVVARYKKTFGMLWEGGEDLRPAY